MVCLGNMCVGTLHKGENDDDDIIIIIIIIMSLHFDYSSNSAVHVT